MWIWHILLYTFFLFKLISGAEYRILSSSRWFQNILYLSRLIIYSTCVWLCSGFPADCLHRGVLQAAQHKIRSVFVAPEPSATMERMADEKVNLTFVDSFLYSCCFKKQKSLPIVFHWCEFPEEPSSSLLWFCACVYPVCAVFTSRRLALL